MGYEIEISCALGKMASVKKNIIAKALRCNCEYHYEQYDIQGRRKQIYRKRHIMTFIFPDEDIPMQIFIRYIKALQDVYIECIATDSGSFEILYASPKYLSLMEKDKAKEYRENHKSLINV